jgi:two-component system nitrogen regulation response regulator GlnG
VPDLLITDVMMPRLDGWTLLASVRERTPALPVIVISAVERREAAQREFFHTDHTVFLRKPFDIETLLTLVERLTDPQPR